MKINCKSKWQIKSIVNWVTKTPTFHQSHSYREFDHWQTDEVGMRWQKLWNWSTLQSCWLPEIDVLLLLLVLVLVGQTRNQKGHWAVWGKKLPHISAALRKLCWIEAYLLFKVLCARNSRDRWKFSKWEGWKFPHFWSAALTFQCNDSLSTQKQRLTSC